MKTTFSYFPEMFENKLKAKYYFKKSNQNILWKINYILMWLIGIWKWRITSISTFSPFNNKLKLNLLVQDCRGVIDVFEK